jgi:hypothetical protein
MAHGYITFTFTEHRIKICLPISIPPGRSEGTVVKIVLLVVGPLFIAVGLFWFARGTGLLPWPHNLAMVDYGAGVVALGIGLVWFGWQ